MGDREIVDKDYHINFIDSTWDFKCTLYPGGLIKKFKVQFCARGDQYLELISFLEIYALVVQWKSIWLMLVIEVLLGSKYNKGDVTASFIHTEIPEN